MREENRRGWKQLDLEQILGCVLLLVIHCSCAICTPMEQWQIQGGCNISTHGGWSYVPIFTRDTDFVLAFQPCDKIPKANQLKKVSRAPGIRGFRAWLLGSFALGTMERL